MDRLSLRPDPRTRRERCRATRLATAAGLATLEVITAPGVFDAACTRARRLIDGLAAAAGRHGVALTTTVAGTMGGFFTGVRYQELPGGHRLGYGSIRAVLLEHARRGRLFRPFTIRGAVPEHRARRCRDRGNAGGCTPRVCRACAKRRIASELRLMAWYPFFVRMDGRRCLVVGGGSVAYPEGGWTARGRGQRHRRQSRILAWLRRSRRTLPRLPAPRARAYSARDLSPSRSSSPRPTTTRQMHRLPRRGATGRRLGERGRYARSLQAQAPRSCAAARCRWPSTPAASTPRCRPCCARNSRSASTWFEAYLGALARVREFLRALPIDADVRRRVLRELADPVMRDECRRNERGRALRALRGGVAQAPGRVMILSRRVRSRAGD